MSDDDHVINFTPAAGFDIRKAAKKLVDLMNDLNQPLIMHLKDVTLEFEPGCTRKQLIEGYTQALKDEMAGTLSNANDPE